jgi:hypothetical protein
MYGERSFTWQSTLVFRRQEVLGCVCNHGWSIAIHVSPALSIRAFFILSMRNGKPFSDDQEMAALDQCGLPRAPRDDNKNAVSKRHMNSLFRRVHTRLG